ncbi:ABC transporter substrate-binding protein [Devosia sp.]|uniref:ABC transporter substrate-binding protein n=1 Tax=Devosia sp. TaxID=1871048 RepID=UPI002EE7254D
MNFHSISRRLLGAALLASVFALPAAAQQDAVIDFALGAPILTLDPGVAAGTQAQSVRVQIMETLVQMNAETAEIEPLLAERWEVSGDNLTWTFHLRQGVSFHDGSPLTAQDVVASISRIINPSAGMGRANDLREIKQITAVDDHTVQIVTAAPSGTLLRALALDSASVLSAASIEKFGDQLGWNPVGTGPFKYDSHVAEQSVRVVRNDAYWGEAPKVEAVNFITVPEATTRLTMLETGEADIIVDVPGFEVDRLRNTDGIELIERSNTRLGHIGINTAQPPFDNVLVRQALNFAVDRQAIVSGILRGVGVPADSIIASTVIGYAPQNLYSYDPDRARQLLAEAGHPNGFTTTIRTPQGRYYMDRETVIGVQAQLAAVGITANVEVIDWSTYLSVLRKPAGENDTALYLLGWETGTADISQILNTVFDSANVPPNGWNTMFYKNAEVDALRAQIAQEIDQSRRMQLAAQVQELIMKDAPWVPLYSYVQVTAHDAALHGVEYLATDIYRFKNAAFE